MLHTFSIIMDFKFMEFSKKEASLTFCFKSRPLLSDIHNSFWRSLSAACNDENRLNWTIWIQLNTVLIGILCFCIQDRPKYSQQMMIPACFLNWSFTLIPYSVWSCAVLFSHAPIFAVIGLCFHSTGQIHSSKKCSVSTFLFLNTNHLVWPKRIDGIFSKRHNPAWTALSGT